MRKMLCFHCLIKVCCLLEGKLENISVIANDSILIEVGVCVCDKRAVIWHVTEIFLFTFFIASHSFLFSLYLSRTTSHCHIVPLFTFQKRKRCLTMIAEAVTAKEVANHHHLLLHLYRH